MRRDQRNGPTSGKSVSATCAVTKNRAGLLSVSLSTPSQRNRSCPQIQPCATSGQAEMLKKLYAGDAAETVWGDQNLRNRAPR